MVRNQKAKETTKGKEFAKFISPLGRSKPHQELRPASHHSHEEYTTIGQKDAK